MDNATVHHVHNEFNIHPPAWTGNLESPSFDNFAEGPAETLTTEDYKAFLELKIPPELVDRQEIFRITRAEAKERCAINLEADGGVCFQHFQPPINGNWTNYPTVSYSIRQDGNVEPRYKSSPEHYPYIVKSEYPERFSDPTVPIVLVEAQKAAIAVTRWFEDHDFRYLVAGMGGVTGWRGKTGIAPDANGLRKTEKGLSPYVRDLCQGHPIYILCDANVTPARPDLMSTRAWLATTLLEEKVSNEVWILTLPAPITAPHWNGPDDFMRYHDDDAFLKVLQSAVRLEDPVDWKGTFHQIHELASGKPRSIIDGYIEEGVSWLGAKSGVGKSWLGLAEAKSLRTGEKFLDTFSVPERCPVLYYIPEMTERRFKNRCELLDIDIHDPEFLVRTMNDGAPLPLNDPRVRACVQALRPVVFLDTAVRFNTGKDENSAGDVSHGLVAAVYQLIQLGARAVRCLHHRAKESSDDELSLENVLRGSGDFGASAVCVWGAVHETALRAGRLAQFDTRGRRKPGQTTAADRISREYLQESKHLGRCYLECVKPGDNEILLWNFRIQLRPSIDDFGKIEMLTAPPLPEPDPGPKLDAFLTANPDTTGDALAQELGIHRTSAIRRAKARGWSYNETSKLWSR